MEEVKVNDYVRTKEGYIAKLIHYGINKGINGKSCLFDRAIRDISNLVYDEDNFLFDSELKQYIIKHSSNIIDLIEVGDVVTHGEETIFITAFESEEQLDYFINLYKHENLSIKSIVTKEQFALAEYKVKE